jgi:hypothetical protein
MTEHIHGTIKQGETIIFADLGLTLIGRKVAGGLGTKCGSFHVPDRGHIDIGASYQLYLPDGRWAEIVIHSWQEDNPVAWFNLLGDWRREK